MEHIEPLVSVVIPTRNRPDLVVRSVNSALAQSFNAIEIIIVVDGFDEATLQMLQQIDDSRVRVLTLPVPLGAGGARNAGVNEARSQWIAFLDDDDEWFPRKLEIQIQTAHQSRHHYPIISCRLIARSETGDLVWPRRYPRPNEPLSEYLFCQSSFFGGEGFIAMPSILAMKELFQIVPFRGDIMAHIDWDWFLRANKIEGVGVEFVTKDEPLLIWYMEGNRSRISNRTDWRNSLSWVEANRHLLTPRAFSSFIMIQVSVHAARGREWKAFWLLLRKAYRNGNPSLTDILAHIIIWLIPRKVRTKMVIFFDRIRCSRVSKHS